MSDSKQNGNSAEPEMPTSSNDMATNQENRSDVNESVELAVSDQGHLSIETVTTMIHSHLMLTRDAFPDLHLVIEDVISSADKVVTRWTLSGTHLGEFASVAPTGRLISLRGITIGRLEDGRVVETWSIRDELRLATELGLVNHAALPAAWSGGFW